MSITLDLPEDVLARLAAEAERRQVSIESLIVEFADRLPIDALEDFIGCGESGMEQPLDMNAERARLAGKLHDEQ